jgi:branched-chain amino acid transport system ATP-binding protein
VKVGTGAVTLRGDDVTNERADVLVSKGIGFVPQTNNVFPSLTIEENLQMGCYQAPSKFTERFKFVTDLFRPSATAATSVPARCRVGSGRWLRWGVR